MSLPRPPAGGESCLQDSFLLYRKFLRQKDINRSGEATFYAQEICPDGIFPVAVQKCCAAKKMLPPGQGKQKSCRAE